MRRLATCQTCQTEAPIEAVHCPHCGQPMPRQLLAVGEVIAEDYEIVRILGYGGMGEVYLAQHQLTGQQVAVKVLAMHLSDDVDLRIRFLDEARILARLDHPHVVMLHNFKAEHSRLCLFMQYVDGESLDRIIEREGPLGPEAAAAVFAPICDALHHAHENAIIHRDVKPSNILVDRTGKPKLTDFGIAKLTAGGADLTRTGVRVGTSWFMSPEQGLNRPIDGRSDIYALGVTLYNALSGRLPFGGNSEYEVIKGHVELPPPPIFTGDDPQAQAIEAVVMKAIAKNAEDRYQTALEMRDALWTIAGESAPSMNPSVPRLSAALAAVLGPAASGLDEEEPSPEPAARPSSERSPVPAPGPAPGGDLPPVAASGEIEVPRSPITPVRAVNLAEAPLAPASAPSRLASPPASAPPGAPPSLQTPTGRAAAPGMAAPSVGVLRTGPLPSLPERASPVPPAGPAPESAAPAPAAMPVPPSPAGEPAALAAPHVSAAGSAPRVEAGTSTAPEARAAGTTRRRGPLPGWAWAGLVLAAGVVAGLVVWLLQVTFKVP